MRKVPHFSVKTQVKTLRFGGRKCRESNIFETSGYATWFTAGGAIRIADYDVTDDVITRKL